MRAISLGIRVQFCYVVETGIYTGFCLQIADSSVVCTSKNDPVLFQVFKYLLPVTLMLIGENKAVAAQTITKSTQTCRDHAVSFAW